MSAASDRAVPVDAARGMAMLFSCLAHFTWWIEPAYPSLASVLADLGKVATPTFLLRSGAMTGWLCASPTRHPDITRFKILNRGLFLLTFGHLLVSLAESHRDGGIWRTLLNASIVDEIGLCMVLCALLFPWLKLAPYRHYALWFGSILFAVCWILVLAWHPGTDTAIFWRQVWLGPDPLGASVAGYSSPTLQYIAVFTIGVAAGDRLQAIQERPDLNRLAGRFLLSVGTALVTLTIALWMGRHAANHYVPGLSSEALNLTLSVTHKFPPSPAYLTFFAGIGMALASAFFLNWNRRHEALHRVAAVLAVVGRASLFVFVLQYFVYWTLPDLLGIAPGPRAPWVFFIDLAIIWIAAWGWGRVGGNRLLTLGLRPPSQHGKPADPPPRPVR